MSGSSSSDHSYVFSEDELNYSDASDEDYSSGVSDEENEPLADPTGFVFTTAHQNDQRPDPLPK